MKKSTAQLWRELPEVSPAEGLVGRIVRRITIARRRRLVLRGTALAAVTIVSLTGFAVAIRYVIDELYLSGFIDYAQLLASNFSLAGSFWKPLALSLIESLPLISIALVAIIGGVALWSSIRTIRTIGKIRQFSW